MEDAKQHEAFVRVVTKMYLKIIGLLQSTDAWGLTDEIANFCGIVHGNDIAGMFPVETPANKVYVMIPTELVYRDRPGEMLHELSTGPFAKYIENLYDDDHDDAVVKRFSTLDLKDNPSKWIMDPHLWLQAKQEITAKYGKPIKWALVQWTYLRLGGRIRK